MKSTYDMPVDGAVNGYPPTFDGARRIVPPRTVAAMPTDNTGNTADNTPEEVDQSTVNKLGNIFYGGMILFALIGGTGAAKEWLGWNTLGCVGAVLLVETAGVYASYMADVRQRMGERAIVSRAFSLALAAFAVGVQYFGHADKGLGIFFAAMSAAGYCLWLIRSAQRRRDALRAAGNLPPVPPSFPLWQRLREPFVTARARTLAKEHGLKLYPALEAAREQIRQRRRTRAIAAVLHRRLRAGLDPISADLAIATYDLDTIAEGIRDSADYDGYVALITQEMSAERVAAATEARARRPWWKPWGKRNTAPAVMTVGVPSVVVAAPPVKPAVVGVDAVDVSATPADDVLSRELDAAVDAVDVTVDAVDAQRREAVAELDAARPVSGAPYACSHADDIAVITTKADAIRYAMRVLGDTTPAEIVTWLARHGREVSRQQAQAELSRARNTGEFPTITAQETTVS